MRHQNIRFWSYIYQSQCYLILNKVTVMQVSVYPVTSATYLKFRQLQFLTTVRVFNLLSFDKKNVPELQKGRNSIHFILMIFWDHLLLAKINTVEPTIDIWVVPYSTVYPVLGYLIYFIYQFNVFRTIGMYCTHLLEPLIMST